MDFCAYCVAALYTSHVMVRDSAGEPLPSPNTVSRDYFHDYLEKLESGLWRAETFDGRLPMRAVTTVSGTRVCGVHADMRINREGRR